MSEAAEQTSDDAAHQFLHGPLSVSEEKQLVAAIKGGEVWDGRTLAQFCRMHNLAGINNGSVASELTVDVRDAVYRHLHNRLFSNKITADMQQKYRYSRN